MELARVAIVQEKRTSQKRWQYGVNVFEGYIEEALAHLRLPYRTYLTLEEAWLRRPTY